MTRDPDRNIKPQTDGERFDEPLDRLVSGAKPAVPGFEGDLADFRAGVKQRVAVVRRRRRRRLAARGALAAAVLLVGLVGLDFQDLGSDGFDVEKIDTKGSYEAYQEKFRDSRFIVQDDWTEAEAEEYHRLIRSHYGKPIGMEGYQVDDAPPHLFISRDIELSTGRHIISGSTVQVEEKEMGKEDALFMLKEIMPIRDRVKSGEIPARKGRRLMTLRGIQFDCRSWELEINGRRATILEGTPVADEKGP